MRAAPTRGLQAGLGVRHFSLGTDLVVLFEFWKKGGEARKAVAIIGDGAMTAGMAFEALNNAGVPHAGTIFFVHGSSIGQRAVADVPDRDRRVERLANGHDERSFDGAAVQHFVLADAPIVGTHGT